MSVVDAWYVVQTHVNVEAKAACNLMRQGFEPYLPHYLKRRSHARKVDQVAAPLFPRYLFVRIDMQTQRWTSIQSTSGVARLVCNGSDPVPVASHVVATLKAREGRAAMFSLMNARGFRWERRCACRREYSPTVSDCLTGWLITIVSRSCLTCWGERFGSRSRPARSRLLEVA